MTEEREVQEIKARMFRNSGNSKHAQDKLRAILAVLDSTAIVFKQKYVVDEKLNKIFNEITIQCIREGDFVKK